MRHVLSLVAALAFLAFTAVPSVAQDQRLSAADYVGVWHGVTDWRGADGYDNPTASWDFRADGTFVDDYGAVGSWSVGADGYITFTYPANTNDARYSGVIINRILVGTMANNGFSGAFAALQ